MKRTLFILTLLALAIAACAPTPGIGAITPPYVDTGVDPEVLGFDPCWRIPLRTARPYDRCGL